MLFGYWQLKTTVYVLLLTSCLGQELFRVCERDYCFEQFDKSRKADPNDLSEWQRSHEQRQILRQLNDRVNSNLEREILRRSDNRDAKSRLGTKCEDRLNAQNVEHDLRMRLNENQKERRRSQMQSDERDERFDIRETHRDTSKSEDVARESLQPEERLRQSQRDTSRERETKQRRDENKSDRDSSRRSEIIYEKRYEDQRRLDDRRAQREVSNLQIVQNSLKERQTNEIRDENQRERLERSDANERINNRMVHSNLERRSDDNIEGRRDSLRRFDAHDTQRELETYEERSDTLKRSQERRETLMDLHEHRNRNSLEQVERLAPLRRLDNREAHRNCNAHLKDYRESIRYDERSQNEDELIERRYENKRERQQCEDNLRLDNSRELVRNDERLSQREQESIDRRRNEVNRERKQRKDTSSRAEHQQILEQLDGRQTQSISKRGAEETRESSRNDNILNQRQRESCNRRNKNNREDQVRRDNLSYLEELRNVKTPERNENSRQINNRKVQLDSNRRLEDSRVLIRHIDILPQREQESFDRRHEKSFKYQEQKDTLRRVDNTRERVARHEILRRIDERQTCSENTRELIRKNDRHSQRQQESGNRRDSIERKDENNGERIQFHEKVQRYFNRCLEDTRGFVRNNEQPSQRQRESEDSRNEIIRVREHENNLERKECHVTFKRIMNDEQELIDRGNENNQERIERYEAFRRINVLENRRDSNRRSEETHESLRVVEQLSQMERESTDSSNEHNRVRKHEHDRERIGRKVTYRRINNPENRLDFNRRLENIRESVSNDEQEFTDRRNGNSKAGNDANNEERIERYEAFRRIDVPVNRFQSNRRLEDTRKSVRNDERFSQKEQELVDNRNKNNKQRHDENKQERTERYVTGRRIDEPKNRFDLNIRSEDTRESLRNNERHSQKEQISINRRYEENREGEDENNREQTERRIIFKRIDDRQANHNINKRFDDTPELLRKDDRQSQRERKSIELRDVNYRAREERGYTLRYLEERNDYTEKPTIFLRNGYVVLGQGAILAYVLLTTLNGKNELKFQLPLKLRQAAEIISF